MREIKFRAWVKPEDLFYESDQNKHPKGRMYTGFTFESINSGREEASVYADTDTWEEPKWGNAVIMQYTGRKDYKGVEIYEGDIVRASYADEDYNEYATISAVEWDGLGFDLSKENLRGLDDEQLEVIGNMYENPDILK